MSIDKVNNINPADKQDSLQSKIRQNSDNSDFMSMLHEFVQQNKTVHTEKIPEKPYENIQNVNNYSSYNQLKVNHLDHKTANSLLVKKILDENSDEDRQSKIENAKKRIDSGFYFREDIIQETAGKIIDSMLK